MPFAVPTVRALIRSLWGLAVLLAVGCGAKGEAPGAEEAGRPVLVATIPPVAMMLREVAGERAEVRCLLTPGSSPHTFSPRPSDAAACQGAALVVGVAPVLDGWAARLAPEGRLLDVMDLLPADRRLDFQEDHDHGADDGREDHGGAPVADPHFWMDPEAVRAILPALAGRLAAADPAGAPAYRAGAARFEEALGQLDTELAAMLGPVRGRAAGFFHPSFQYLLHRYGLVDAGLIEPVPGKSPTPRELMELGNALKKAGARALVTEPQLPRRPAEMLAETTGLPLIELDPLGGVAGRERYGELLTYNAQKLAEALK